MTYYKLTRPDGWDFWTGKTINYADAVGKTVKHPNPNPILGMCSSGVLHASDDANKAFLGAKIPCRLFEVEGNPVIPHDTGKAGFTELFVSREIDPKEHFEWDYELASNPVHPLKITPFVTDQTKEMLVQWHSVAASVTASMTASVTVSGAARVADSVAARVESMVRTDSVADRVADRVRDRVRGRVRTYRVFDSVWDSVEAYIGYIFRNIVHEWKYIDTEPGMYPFQASVDLWNKGLVPSFDGATWRLHGYEDARILYEWKP